ncbi:hypothetical protein DOE76_14000 [Leifsonia sp. ku-ls]|jgi:uncharacterized membrane protein|nr:hypothetical protein DOE76_14000 [Leifsonia sp. ku-ls]
MATRPGSVTFVAVLTYLNGILDIIGGVVLLLTRDQVSGAGGSAAITTSAIVSLLLGIVTVVVARGLLRGSSVSRALVAVVMVIDLLNGVLLLFTSQVVTGVIQILWSILIVALLFTRRANAFFTGR